MASKSIFSIIALVFLLGLVLVPIQGQFKLQHLQLIVMEAAVVLFLTRL